MSREFNSASEEVQKCDGESVVTLMVTRTHTGTTDLRTMKGNLSLIKADRRKPDHGVGPLDATQVIFFSYEPIWLATTARTFCTSGCH